MTGRIIKKLKQGKRVRKGYTIVARLTKSAEAIS